MAGVDHEAFPDESRGIRQPVGKHGTRRVEEETRRLDGVAAYGDVAGSLQIERLRVVTGEVKDAGCATVMVMRDLRGHAPRSYLRTRRDGSRDVGHQYRALCVGRAPVVAEPS